MKTKLMSLGSIIIHVVVCCCLLAATTGCSNSKDSANARAIELGTVQNSQFDKGAQTLLTADPLRQGPEQDTEVKDKEYLESLVEGLEDKDVARAAYCVFKRGNNFGENIAKKLDFEDVLGFNKAMGELGIKTKATKGFLMREVLKALKNSTELARKIQLYKVNEYKIENGQLELIIHTEDKKAKVKKGKTFREKADKHTPKIRKTNKPLTDKKLCKEVIPLVLADLKGGEEQSAAEAIKNTLNAALNKIKYDTKEQEASKEDPLVVPLYKVLKADKNGFKCFKNGLKGQENPYTNLDQIIKDMDSSN